MKKKLFPIFAILLLLTGCGDFLEETSQDEIRPTSTEDIASVLYSSAYPYLFSSDGYLILLTDEVENHPYSLASYEDRMAKGKPVYCFSKTMFDGDESFIPDENSWKNYYTLIKGCNVVMDYIDEMKGKEEDRRFISGQARALRAYYYLRLLMIYCLPYDESIADSELGLSHIISSHVSDNYPNRESLRATYDFVESELKQASQELDGFVPTTIYRITKPAVDVLLSRLYLYEKKWDKVIEYASAAIANGPKLTDFKTLGSLGVYDVNTTTEVIWNYTGAARTSDYIQSTNMVSGGYLPYNLSASVMNMYEAGDMRNCTTPVYSKKYVGGYASGGFYVQKILSYSSQNGENGVRMSEAYLNRAEAYTQKGDNVNALADLNHLRENRFAAASYQPLSITNNEELKMFVRDERQRELVWEGGFRWMDIKRYGLSVTHVFTDEDGSQTTYTLQAGDPLYALPIPHDAISKNPNLKQNKR